MNRGVRALPTVVGHLIIPAQNLRAKVWELVFSFALADSVNGVSK